MNKLTEKIIYDLLKEKKGVSLSESNYKTLLNEYWSKIEKMCKLLRWIPFIEEVAVCNNLSFEIIDEKSDIDLLFILNSDRFFIGRFMISVILELFGMRRKNNLIAGRLCLSFFATTGTFSLKDIEYKKSSRKDYYLQFWYKNLIFLKSDFNIQNKIIELNQSFMKIVFFKNMFCLKENAFSKNLNNILNWRLFNILELFMKWIQLKRAFLKNEKLNNPYGVIIKPGFLKFHVTDIRHDFNQKVEKSL